MQAGVKAGESWIPSGRKSKDTTPLRNSCFSACMPKRGEVISSGCMGDQYSPFATRYLSYFFLLLCGVVSLGAGRPIFLPFTHGPRGLALSWSTINAFSSASRGVSTIRVMECAMSLLRSLRIILFSPADYPLCAAFWASRTAGLHPTSEVQTQLLRKQPLPFDSRTETSFSEVILIRYANLLT